MHVLLLASLLSSCLCQRTFALLKNVRQNITFVPYTPQQRVQVASAIEHLLSVYVNRDEKIAYYAKHKPDMDPIPRAKAIQNHAANLTDKDFHYQYSDLFVSLRDFHTNYEMPAPHRCYSALTAIAFQLSDPADIFTFAKEVVAVSAFSVFKEVLDLSTDIQNIAIGDTLQLVDGIPFAEYFEKNQFQTGGANEFGGERSAIASLSLRSGMLYKMPQKDEITFTLKSTITRKTYTVVLPWVASARNSCLGEVDLYLQDPSKKVEIVQDTSRLQFDDLMMMDPTSHEPKTSVFKLMNTSDPIIKYGIYDPARTNLGVLVLESFVPIAKNADNVVTLVRDLLLNQLANTKSLVIDIRNNGGGIAGMANKLPQLFSPMYFKNGKIKALVTQINSDIFKSGQAGEEWKKAYSLVAEGDRYTPLVQFDSDESCNTLGQAYFKPVGVFNNGKCYSACDFFSANMQDNDISIIFGEDGRTGAGGANVVEYNGFFSRLQPVTFPLMPLTAQLPTSHQDLRVAWRQGVRIGKNAGALIEDYGVSSDFIVRPSITDIIATNSNSQWQRIASKLEGYGQSKQISHVFFKTTPDLSASFEISAPLNYTITTSSIKTVTVSSEDGTALSTTTVANHHGKTTMAVLAETGVTKTGFKKFKMVGRNANDLIVASFFCFVRFIPSRINWFRLDEPMIWDLSIGAPGVGVFNVDTLNEDGWATVDGVARVGQSGNYKDNVDTKLSFFVTPTSPATNITVSIAATYSTEQYFDMLRVGYTDTNGDHDFLDSKDKTGKFSVNGVSGTGVISSSWTAAPEGAFEVYVWFKSDGALNSKGVEITSFRIAKS